MKQKTVICNNITVFTVSKNKNKILMITNGSCLKKLRWKISCLTYYHENNVTYHNGSKNIFLFLYEKSFLYSWFYGEIWPGHVFMSPIPSGLFVSSWRWSGASILSPCSYFVSICLICLKQQTVRMKKSKFLRGSFWVCTDVLPTKHQSDIIDVLFHPSSTLNRTIYSSNTVINSPLSINPEDSLACI